MRVFHIEATEAEMLEFIAWCWNWWEYDQIEVDDPDFRRMAAITWQIKDQLPKGLVL